ncbi:MAG: DUF2059 domain-containing protein [Novosphingobium sp.]
MKRLMAWFAVCVIAASVAPAAGHAQSTAAALPDSGLVDAPDEAKVALGRQIIASIFPPEKRDDMLLAMAGAIVQQYRNGFALPQGMDDPGLMKILDEFMVSVPMLLKPVMQQHLPAMHEAMARAYAREFTLAELSDVLAFTRTPSGARYMMKSNALLADKDVAASNTAYFAAIQKVSVQNSAELKSKVMDYLLKHPDVLKKIGENPKTK